MANLTVKAFGLKFKNPIISASDEYGGTIRMARRAVKQGLGGLVTKTVHQIPGPERCTRPHMFPLKKFGKGLEDAFYCSHMFSYVPYEEWINVEGPGIQKLCRENDVRFIVSMSGTGENLESWKRLARDQEKLGAEMLELNIGGPHATFGADVAVKDVGAPIGLDPEKAYKVTKAVTDIVSIPVSCKMTPVANVALVASACEKAGAAAISANNACYGIFIDVEAESCYGVPCFAGFSMGRGWQGWSLAKVMEITKTVKIPVMGIGGVFTYEDAARYIMAGCPVVQVCSAKFMEGITVIKKIIDGLDDFMERKGYQSIEDFRGVVLKDVVYLRDYPKEKVFTMPSPVLPRFDMEKCKPCNICENLCPQEVISRPGGKPEVDEEHCVGCGFCVGACPREAITLRHVKTGEIIWNGHGTFKQWVK